MAIQKNNKDLVNPMTLVSVNDCKGVGIGKSSDDKNQVETAVSQSTISQLARSYKELEKKFRQLSVELEKTEKEKIQQQTDNEKIATQFEALINFLPGGVIVLDERGRVVESNPAAKAILSYEPDNKLWRRVVSDCFSPKGDDGFEVSTHSGRRISIRTGSLGTQGQIILLTDQTETRRLQENVGQYEKLSALGKMVSALAHQIRTPLSTAMLYAGHLRRGVISEEKKEVFTEKLYGRLQHMEKQVRDMMLFVKNELPLNDVITLENLQLGLEEAAEVPIATSNVDCEWVNELENAQIKCNREGLISAIMNLVNNGIQASYDPIRMRVDIKKEKQRKGFVRIEVIDNGAGMTKEQMLKATQVFHTTKSQGTGLGITVVQSVVKAHGGVFGLESTPGEGTKAIILLPITK